MKAKEEWIRETMESIDSIRSIDPNPFLYDKIIHRLETGNGKVLIIQMKTIWRVAAFIAILLMLNVLSAIHYHKSSFASTNEQANPFANEYFSYMKNIQL